MMTKDLNNAGDPNPTHPIPLMSVLGVGQV